jgi:predicted  nucleic acid-binding Zn-ribbon protein
MNPTMTGLIELQRVDDEIFQVKRHRDEIAANLARLGTLLTRMEAGLAEKREKLAEASRFHADKRLDHETNQERLAASKTRSLGISRSKEYAALTKEVEHLRKRQQEDEQQLAELSTSIEAYRTAISEEEGKLADIKAEVAREQEVSEVRVREFEVLIGRVSARRAELEGKLPREIAGRYNRVLERRDGTAVVLAIRGRCTGCNMSTPPQIWVKIQLGHDIFQCASCQRFLYYSVEEAAAVHAAQS